MDPYQLIALVIFIFTFLLISVGRLGRWGISMPLAALVGGALMLATGTISPAAAVSAVNWPTIGLVLGMMLIVAGMGQSGFFQWAANLLTSAAGTERRFLVSTSLLTALLSSLILNDAVVLIFTPVIISSARKMRISPVPPLILEALSANIGSAATEVGNPQNAYIANVSGISFSYFSEHLLPVSLLSLLFAVLYCSFIAGREGGSELQAAPPRDSSSKFSRRMSMSVIAVGAVFSSFYLLPLSYAPAAALVGGILLLLALQVSNRGAAAGIVAGVDWGILLFFGGLFILIGGVEKSGLLGLITSSIHSLDARLLTTVGGLTLLTALLSNMVSNVPAVLLLSGTIRGTPGSHLWLVLAASSTLAGNATVIGAAANVIVVRAALREGIAVRTSQFMKYGLPVTFVSLIVAFAVLSLW